jgi:hypothetical protein
MQRLPAECKVLHGSVNCAALCMLLVLLLLLLQV